MSERTHGCWLDLCEGETADRCVLETGEPVESCCVAIKLRADGKTQWSCEYWKPLNPEQPSEVESLRAEIARLRLAIRRLADQDATLSVCDGNVTVTMDATLTDAEREAVRRLLHWVADRPCSELPVNVETDHSIACEAFERLGGVR